VGSSVRIAAATCLMASGLLAGGGTAAIAFADPVLTGDGSGDKHTNDSVGNGRDEKPTSDPDEKNTTPGAGGKAEDPKAEDGKKDEENDGDNNGIGGNPNNGNCGNSGSNGNAQGCGGANDPDDPPTTKPTRPPTPEEPPQPPDDPAGARKRTRMAARPGGRGGLGHGHGIQVSPRHWAVAAAVAPPRWRPVAHRFLRRCSCRPS
jgi:hypothetical protein